MSDDASVLGRPASEPDSVVRWGPGAVDVADLRRGRDSGRRTRTDLPLVVMLHGGFWRPEYDRLHVRPMTEAIAAAGFTVVAPEYRRTPGGPYATCDDVRSTLAVLPGLLAADHDGRVIVVGHSAGGHLALWSAVQAPAPGLCATVALAPVADLVAAEREHLGSGAVTAFLGGPAYDQADLDPVRLPSPGTPVTVLHGADDRTVPMSQAASYAAAHPAVALEALPSTGHFELIDPLSGAWPRVMAALERAAAAPRARTAGPGLPCP